jgi:hypothetical protein
VEGLQLTLGFYAGYDLLGGAPSAGVSVGIQTPHAILVP